MKLGLYSVERMKIPLVISFCLLVLDCKANDSDTDINPIVIRLDCFKPRKITGCEVTEYSLRDVYFFLFTRENPEHPEYLHACNRKLPNNTNFNASHPTEMIIPGLDDMICTDTVSREMKDQYLKRGPYNIILVDWGNANTGIYYHPLRGIKPSAKQLATLIDNIKEQTGVSSENFHCVGHSLGAHFCGSVGKLTKMRRITGLDPAGPSFYNNSDRLTNRDARLVDVMHTDAGRCLPKLGYIYPVGDEDFYVNGGSVQLSCYTTSILGLLKGSIAGLAYLILPTACFHSQATEYYKVTINPENCQFIGKKCNNYQNALAENCDKTCNSDFSNCAIMGLDWEEHYQRKLSEQRVYSVKTSLFCPYCIPDQ